MFYDDDDTAAAEPKYTVKCPYCTALLQIDQDKDNPKSDDPLSCYFHGVIGTRLSVFLAAKNGDLEIVSKEPTNEINANVGTSAYYGQATYYNLPGSSTASGTPFDPNAMAGAMTSEKVPLGSSVTITYKAPNGKTTSIRVKINDRGPFARNPDGTPIHPLRPDSRDIIDLTPEAFRRLTGSTTLGRINVTVTTQ